MFCWTNVYLLCNMMFSGFLVAWFISEACEKCMRASPKTIYEKIGKKKKKRQELLCRRCLVGDFEFCFYKAAGI